MFGRGLIVVGPAITLAGMGLIMVSKRQFEDVESANKQGILLLDNGTEPQGLDPHIVTGVPEHHLLISLCEGLTTEHPKGGPSQPGAAESWEISEDGKEYIFYLNKKKLPIKILSHIKAEIKKI